MSTLNLPRIHFKGTFKVNPPTTNNDDVNDFIDPTTMTVIHEPPDITNDWDFRVYMMQLQNFYASPPQQGQPTPPIYQLINAGWNYFGDGNTTFEDTYTTTGQLLNGNPISANDPVLNAQVQILGNKFGDNYGAATLVDLDPNGTFNTQIFANQFQVTANLGGTPTPLLTGVYPLHFQSEWLNALRNLCKMGTDTGASAMWQFCIPNDSLTFNQGVGSQGLSDLNQAAGSNMGIMVMFCIYYMQPKITNADLAQQFQQTSYQQAISNPSYGAMVGTIGAWYNGETQTVLNGRMLYPNQPFTYSVTCQSETPKVGRYKSSVVPMELLATKVDDTATSTTVGPALTYIDYVRQVIVLDLKATLPEIDSSLAKYNLGDLLLQAISYDGTKTPIATIPYSAYNQQAYEASAGVMEISYAGTGLNFGGGSLLLQLIQQNSSAILVQDLAYPEIKTDMRTCYMNVGDTIQIPVIGTAYGTQPAYDALIQVQQYINVVAYQPPPPPPQLPTISQIGIFPVNGTTILPVVSLPVPQFTLDGAGGYQMVVNAIAPGTAYLRFYLPYSNMPVQADPFLSWQYDFYCCIRVLPLDDAFDNVPDSQLIGEANWNFMYQNVFRYYYLIYPAMAARIDFSSYTDCQRNASIIKQFVAERTITSSLYMPVTRELSDGKRRLIQRWCTLNG